MPQQNVTQFYGSCSSLSTKVSHPIPSALHFGWLKLPQDRCHQHHPRMELAPYGKQQGRRRESEGWKLNRRGKDHQWWKISSLPSRELTYPTLGKERNIIFKSAFGMGYVSSQEGKIYDVWFLMNIWKFLWCWMISATVGCWLCWLSSTPHNQHHHPSSLHPGATRSPNYQLLGRSIDKILEEFLGRSPPGIVVMLEHVGC